MGKFIVDPRQFLIFPLHSPFSPLPPLLMICRTLRYEDTRICRNCGGQGHITRDCPERKNVTQTIFCSLCGVSFFLFFFSSFLLFFLFLSLFQPLFPVPWFHSFIHSFLFLSSLDQNAGHFKRDCPMNHNPEMRESNREMDSEYQSLMKELGEDNPNTSGSNQFGGRRPFGGGGGPGGRGRPGQNWGCKLSFLLFLFPLSSFILLFLYSHFHFHFPL